MPRTTQDLDGVIDPPSPHALDAVVGSMSPDDYQIDNHDPASIEHPVYSGIRRAPTADLRENRRRYSNERALLVRYAEDRSSTVSEGGPF